MSWGQVLVPHRNFSPHKTSSCCTVMWVMASSVSSMPLSPALEQRAEAMEREGEVARSGSYCAHLPLASHVFSLWTYVPFLSLPPKEESELTGSLLSSLSCCD